MTFNLNTFWTSETAEHIDVAAKTFATLQGDFEKMLNACAASIQNGGKILFFGNGGSAADARLVGAAECGDELHGVSAL